MSNARKKIEEAAAAKGYRAEAEWEPIGPHLEKEGHTGGWTVRLFPLHLPQTSFSEWAGGYNWQEVVDFIEKWVEPALQKYPPRPPDPPIRRRVFA